MDLNYIKEHVDSLCVNIHCHGFRKALLSVWAETLSIVCFVTDVSVVSEKSSCGTGRTLRPPRLWPILSSVCSTTTWQMWPCFIGTVGLFVLHCWKVFKSQTLCDEFWINLSFGRRLPSGALLEWWTDCVGLRIYSFLPTAMGVIECVVNLRTLQFPFISFWLLSNISSDND